MKKYIRGWGRNILSEVNISYPSNLNQLNQVLKEIVLHEVWADRMVIVQFNLKKQ